MTILLLLTGLVVLLCAHATAALAGLVAIFWGYPAWLLARALWANDYQVPGATFLAAGFCVLLGLLAVRPGERDARRRQAVRV